VYSFSEWFPFPVSIDTLWIFLFTIGATLAGTMAGMVFVILEVYKPPNGNPSAKTKLFTDENRLYTIFAFSLGMIFFAFGIGFVASITYGFATRVSIGTVMNVVFKRRLAQIGLSTIQDAAKKANAELAIRQKELDDYEAQLRKAGFGLNLTTPPRSYTTPVTSTHPEPDRG